MERIKTNVNGTNTEYIRLHTAIIGSGAAGLSAALNLWDMGIRDICVFTEGLNMGTSRNTGSDKQTYYKLSLGGDTLDSPRRMAEDLFRGGCVDGDQALVEAASSAKCFYRLCALGVPFPCNAYGEYVGYQTDFDNSRRATSAGPLTSKYMQQALLQGVLDRGIAICENSVAVRILADDGAAIGFVALRRRLRAGESRYMVVNCANIVYATGGPAGLYAQSVYPHTQTGASGIAFEAGVVGKNLTEWQYGIASLKFRWNLSGTYQQVLPRYYSTNQTGGDARDFLREGFSSDENLLLAIFQKGYQWPFNPERAYNEGSSCIDILVYREINERGRRVFLDYTQNPEQLYTDEKRLDLKRAGLEAFEYLEKSGAMQETPLDRLCAMNRPAYELYLSHGIDLAKEPLEIGVCAQHNNGGLQSDANWESDLHGFFPVGEVNGSHGVKRPGGSALNAGQAGALRTAERIAMDVRRLPTESRVFWEKAIVSIEEIFELCRNLTQKYGESTVLSDRNRLRGRMSAACAHIRSETGLKTALAEAQNQFADFAEKTRLSGENELCYAMQNRDLLIAQIVYIGAMLDYVQHGGKSRGSFLIAEDGGSLNASGLKFSLEKGALSEFVQNARWENGKAVCSWRSVRRIPAADDWFEKVWNDYRVRCSNTDR